MLKICSFMKTPSSGLSGLQLLKLNVTMGFSISKLCGQAAFEYLEDDKHHFETMFGGGNVHVITTLETWEKKLLEVKRPHTVAILNFAAAWCVPCKVMAPYYRQLSEKYPSLMFLVIDVDEMPEFPLAWNIESTPTFLFLKDGRHTGKLEGAKIAEVSKRVASLADSLPHHYSKRVS